ncbi:hypothetical protein BMW23_0330 [Bodo saltans virus]|uniref:Uncharacterized protein n=1 Tax=Bodo saltans virus TaxID=2024608 RepID=A0A2H4UU54_9VIRU|nr:hypothetical protein QJ851_gp0324 [Bodo saltans virus]ATZ80387.1 hypothetical protein BMW23_0330 [Bodo saltans virus]
MQYCDNQYMHFSIFFIIKKIEKCKTKYIKQKHIY